MITSATRFTRLKSPKFFIPVLLVTWLVYAYATAKPLGYCEAQKRVIPDEELFVDILNAKIKSGLLELGPSETTGRDYLAHHPDCCRINRTRMAKFEYGGLLYALFTKADALVYVDYELSDAGKKSYGATRTLRAQYSARLIMTSCGEILDYTGMAEGL